MRVIPSQVHGTIIFLVNGALFSPPLGAFGSGATFAMEDGWILARALEHTRFSSRPGQDALEIYLHIIPECKCWELVRGLGLTPSLFKLPRYDRLDEVGEKLKQFRSLNTTSIISSGLKSITFSMATRTLSIRMTLRRSDRIILRRSRPKRDRWACENGRGHGHFIQMDQDKPK